MATVLITGGNRGLGLALAKEFLFREYRVVATCRRPERAYALQEMLQEIDADRLLVLPLDVENADSVSAAAKAFAVWQSPLDVLVNNAGIHPEKGDELFQDLDPAWFVKAFETNVVGAVRVTQAFLPYLLEGRHPRVVNISSGVGSISTKSDHLRYCYGVSKAALNMWTRTLANEWRERGIAVVAMSPGWVRTDMGGREAELSPEETAHAMVRSIGRLQLKHTGLFLDRHGKEGIYHW